MKKILFVVPHMLCGGVEKSLLSLINEIPDKEYEIDILLVKKEGEFLELIPNEVNTFEIQLPPKIRDEIMLGGKKKLFMHYLKRFKFMSLIKMLIKIIQKDSLATLNYNFKNIESIKKKYDIAICFHIHMPFIVRYVAEKINADVKYAWIHNDFKMSKYKVERLEKFLDIYDKYFVVSEQLMDEFIAIFPKYKSNTLIAHNIVSTDYINSLLINNDLVDPFDFDGLKLLTLGRLEHQKGIDLAINVCEILVNKGYDFKWYILGDGSMYKSLKKIIENKNLQHRFVLLGTKMNPYPYIKNCDIYIQPSRHEGYGIAVAEARALFKPIICTDFTGAKEQIKHGVTGSIVRCNIEEIAEAIIDLIENPNKRELYEKNLQLNGDSENLEEIMKILNYFK